MEFDPIDQGVIVDRPGMSGPSSKGCEVRLACSADVGVIDEREGDQFDRIDLDFTVTDPVATAGLHLQPTPQPERHGDVTGQHACTQFLAELHGPNIGQR